MSSAIESTCGHSHTAIPSKGSKPFQIKSVLPLSTQRVLWVEYTYCNCVFHFASCIFWLGVNKVGIFWRTGEVRRTTFVNFLFRYTTYEGQIHLVLNKTLTDDTSIKWAQIKTFSFDPILLKLVEVVIPMFTTTTPSFNKIG